MTQEFIYNFALGLPGLLLAVTVHEVAHGVMASKFGDPTAKLSGRITLNPLAHLDLLGSVIIPIVSILLGGTMFGWAKPVPVSPRNFKNIRKGIFWVSFAGPLANFILVIISAFLCALVYTKTNSTFDLREPLIGIFRQSVIINTILGTFNLIPLPPLDGSKMLSSILPPRLQMRYDEMAKYSFFLFIILMISGLSRYIFMPPLLISNFILSFFIYGL